MKNRVGFFVLTLICCVGLSLLAVRYFMPLSQGGVSVVQETAFDRVMRTGTLRCGYYVFPPITVRDPNTNQLSGLGVDMMNVIAQKTGLKIEWTEEIGFGNWVPALESGRFDAVCTPMWPDMAVGRQVIFTKAAFYTGIGPMVRSDDSRFDQDKTKLNDPSVTVAAIEGNFQQFLSPQVFPKAHLLVEPANSDNSTLALDVTSGKADAFLWDLNGLFDYNKNNPGKLKMLDPDHPIKAEAFSIAVDRHEFGLREFLDNALSDMLLSGTIDRLLDKWQPAPGLYLRATDPYEPEKIQ